LKLASTVTDDHKDHFERQMEQKVKPLNWDVELTFQDYGIICSAKGSPLFSEPHFRLPQKTIFPNSFNSSWQCPPARLISADFFNPMNVAKDFERFAENIKLVGHSEISEPGSSSFHVLCDMIGDLDHNARSQMINNVLEWHSTSTHPRKKFFFNLATAGAQYLTATPVKAVTICRSELPSLEDEGPLRHSNLPVCVELHNNGTYTITQKNISTRTMFIDGDRRDTSEHITWERMFTFKDDALWLVDMSLKAVQWEGIDQEKVEKMKASLSGSWVCLNGDTLAKTIMPVLRPDLGNTGIYIDLLNETVDNQNDISPIIQKLIPFVSDRSYLQNLVNTALTHVSEPHLQPFIYSSISQDPNGFSIRHEVAIEQADRPFAEIPTFSYATKAIFYMILSFDQLGNYSNTTLFPHPIYKNPLPDNLQPYIDEIQRFYRSLAIEEK
jgi:hypothetical protein